MVDGEWWMVTTLIRRIYDNERDGKLNKKNASAFDRINEFEYD